MTTSPDPSNVPLTQILASLARTYRQQEKTLEQTQSNGDGIRDLQPLLDLFRHPDLSVSQLAEMLQGTLTALATSAQLSTKASERVSAALDTFVERMEKQDQQMAQFRDILHTLQKREEALAEGMTALRAEMHDLSFHLGLSDTGSDDD